MANLPQVGREIAVTPQIQSSVSAADVAAPFNEIAQGIGAIGVKLSDYQRMVEAGVVAKENDAAKTAALNLTNQANGDAAAFKTSWDTYAQDRLGKVPQSQRNLVEQNFLTIGGDTYRNILGNTFDRDRGVANDSLDARQKSLTADLSDLAANGQSGTDAYNQKHEELVGLINERVGNPAFNYSQDHANLDVSNIEDTLTGAAVTGELQKIYATDGLAAAQERGRQIMADQTSGLSDIKRLKAVTAGLTSVHALYAQDAQARTDLNAQAQITVAALGDGTLQPDDKLIADQMAQADYLNEPATKLSLQKAQGIARLAPAQNMSLHDSLTFFGSGAPSGGPATDAASIIKREEGFASTASWDVNADRAGYGSDTITLADGTVQKVTKDTVVTQADAERDLQRQLPGLEASNAGLIGADVWSKLPGNVKGPLDSVAYNFGTLPGSVVVAAKTGDPNKIADAVQALGQTADAKAKNLTDRRNREAAIIRSAPSLATYIPGVITEERRILTANLNTALATYDKALATTGSALPHPLSDGQIADLVDAARKVDDSATYDKVATIIAKSDATATMLGTPVASHQPYIDALRAPGPVGEEAISMAATDQAAATDKRKHDLIDSQNSNYDPRVLGIELGLVKPGPKIDWTNLDTAGAELTRRVPEMGSLEIREGQKPGSLGILRPEEATDLAAKITSAPDAQALIQGLQKAAGSAWPRVLNDLVTMGKLPAAYQSVASLDNPRDAALLARALNEVKPTAAGQPGRSWDDILGQAGGTGVATSIRQSVRTDPNVMKFERSLSASGASAPQVDNVISSIETLAFAKKFYDGDSTAAADAITSFTANYRFGSDVGLNGTARIPVKFADATVATARVALQGLTANTVAIPQAFGQPGGPTADDYLNLLKANPTWITSPKEDALWLQDGQGRLVRDNSGNPFAVPFTSTPPSAGPNVFGSFLHLLGVPGASAGTASGQSPAIGEGVGSLAGSSVGDVAPSVGNPNKAQIDELVDEARKNGASDEFLQYYRDQLNKLPPPDVTTTTNKQMAESMFRYNNLDVLPPDQRSATIKQLGAEIRGTGTAQNPDGLEQLSNNFWKDDATKAEVLQHLKDDPRPADVNPTAPGVQELLRNLPDNIDAYVYKTIDGTHVVLKQKKESSGVPVARNTGKVPAKAIRQAAEPLSGPSADQVRWDQRAATLKGSIDSHGKRLFSDSEIDSTLGPRPADAAPAPAAKPAAPVDTGAAANPAIDAALSPVLQPIIDMATAAGGAATAGLTAGGDAANAAVGAVGAALPGALDKAAANRTKVTDAAASAVAKVSDAAGNVWKALNSGQTIPAYTNESGLLSVVPQRATPGSSIVKPAPLTAPIAPRKKGEAKVVPQKAATLTPKKFSEQWHQFFDVGSTKHAPGSALTPAMVIAAYKNAESAKSTAAGVDAFMKFMDFVLKVDAAMGTPVKDGG